MAPNGAGGKPAGGAGGASCSFANLDGRSIEAAIHGLYHNMKEVCTETGRRFSTKEQLQEHKDGLFRKKQAADAAGGAVASRQWFDDSATWLGLKGSGDADEVRFMHQLSVNFMSQLLTFLF